MCTNREKLSLQLQMHVNLLAAKVVINFCDVDKQPHNFLIAEGYVNKILLAERSL